MNVKWSDTERAMLAEMWLCGVSSVDIAPAIGRSRDAVMGRINKSGLMGRQGKGLMHPCGMDAQRAGVDACLADYDANRRGDDYRDVCRVFLAMVASGRDGAALAEVSGVPEQRVAAIAGAFEDTRVWRARSGPPASWWTSGPTAVIEDLQRVAAGIADQMEHAHAA